MTAARKVRGRIGGTLAAVVFVAIAIAGAWFWIWWLPDALASWIGGSSWLWFFVVIIAGIPAIELLVGLGVLVISLPVVGLKAAFKRPER